MSLIKSKARFDVYTACPLPPDHMRKGAEPSDLCYAGFDGRGLDDIQWGQVLVECIKTLSSQQPPLIARLDAFQNRQFLETLRQLISTTALQVVEPSQRKRSLREWLRYNAFVKEPWVFFRFTNDITLHQTIQQFCACVGGRWIIFFEPMDEIISRWVPLRQRSDYDLWDAAAHEVTRCSSVLITDDDCRLDLLATQAQFSRSFERLQHAIESLGYRLEKQEGQGHSL